MLAVAIRMKFELVDWIDCEMHLARDRFATYGVHGESKVGYRLPYVSRRRGVRAHVQLSEHVCLRRIIEGRQLRKTYINFLPEGVNRFSRGAKG